MISKCYLSFWMLMELTHRWMLSSSSKLMFTKNHIKVCQGRNISPPVSNKSHSPSTEYDLWVLNQWQVQSGLLSSTNTSGWFTHYDLGVEKRVEGRNKFILCSRQLLVYCRRHKKIPLQFNGSHAVSLSSPATEYKPYFASLSHHDFSLFSLWA